MIPEHWRAAALMPPYAWGGPLATGRLRASPEDFRVDEILGFEAAGSGPHALLQVRKRGANTEWVGRELARAAGCKPFEVGVAGMKDRHAVTTQHFTVPRGKRAAADFLGLQGEGYEVIAAAEHQRKLPRGALEGNRFEIVVRDFRADAAHLDRRLADLRAGGVPNYFGEQRFGRDAGNLEAVWREAQSLAEPGARRRGGREDGRAFMLSGARSVIFNALLAERVTRGTWNRLEAGDVAMLDGRGSVFAVEAVNADLTARAEALDIHPTAPLVGEGEPLSAGAVRDWEAAVAARFPEALAVIQAERMKPERRALRMRIRDLDYDYAGDVLTLRFTLPAGSFATTMLREIVSGE